MREGALDLAQALDFSCQICNAVDHAHGAGILHRDLRPGNMLVSENGMLKVTDFGTSRFLEIAAHGTTVIGSPPYMAPEQFHGKAVFASDIYSVGVTMYQMLTGDAAVRHAGARATSRDWHAASWSRRRVSRTRRFQKPSTTSSCGRWRPNRPTRYQRAAELLEDLLAARDASPAARRRTRRHGETAEANVAEIQSRLRARETPPARFCWHCRKPLQARTAKCPFCGEHSSSRIQSSRFQVPGHRLRFRSEFWVPVSVEPE